MTEPPVWTQTVQVAPGEHEAVCVQAEATTSAAGNDCIRWVYEFEGGARVAWTTVRRRRESGLAAKALGLGTEFRLSQAEGRRCRVTVTQDGPFLSVKSVRAQR